MALAKVASAAISGAAGVMIEIEAHIGQGLPGVHLVGMADTSVHESKDRVRAAIVNSKEPWPQGRITLALSPATLKKSGSIFDLGLAIAILVAQQRISENKIAKVVYIGELALDGRLRPVSGVLPALVAAKNAGFTRAVVPTANCIEAALVTGMAVGGADTLSEVVLWSTGRGELQQPGECAAKKIAKEPDLLDVSGQNEARFALEAAAAGGHHLFLTGPPGTGKTMLAKRLPGILPPLTEDEALEVTAIHSISGLLTPENPLIATAPFVAPHHNSTIPALIGGGSGLATPGAISRAHRGVLFLDECAEFSASVLDSLRTPMESGSVNVARSSGMVTFPSVFQLILAANPCPCAPAKDVDCVCSPQARRRYLSKLSGPLMDRVDIRLTMAAPRSDAFLHGENESSAVVRERVINARKLSADRWRNYGWRTNSEVPGPELRRIFPLSTEAMRPLMSALYKGRISGRGADRALRLAWTLADLRGAGLPDESDVLQALLFRDRGIV